MKTTRSASEGLPPLSTKKIPFIPEYLSTLSPYVPGKPIEETQREFGLKKVIKLASNENPLGPSPSATNAVRKYLSNTHLYPDAGAFELKQALAKKYGFFQDELCIGNGSNELIEFLIRTFCIPGQQILTSRFAFIAYKISAQAHGVNTVETPMQKNLQFDLEAMLAEVKRQNAFGKNIRLIFIANPNNPTGTLLSRSRLTWFLKEIQSLRDHQGYPLVVLDSAYDEYFLMKKNLSAEAKSELPVWTDLLREFENLVVLKTFSKAFGLAGYRVGVAFGAKEIISRMERVRMPFNVNSLGLIAAKAALGDLAFLKKSIKVNEEGMHYWEKWLNGNEIPFWKSSGNFVLIDTQVRFRKTGMEVFQDLLKLGVILRPVTNYGLPHALRISIGTATENSFATRAFEKTYQLNARPKKGRKK